ncbi:MAPEG family protein [Janthinobacterium sp. SUN128]|uniref:MAPEG family protein n=1 Tax=Janthinobacterium sp. SUN128 TaxID=3014790 RepID=UPI00271278F2|nr:MAPEG family protein [Janthinobacterium sp. SUN128]MDO8034609.1 MAPEG family protein [Janthinobacterium sp. SUN128]
MATGRLRRAQANLFETLPLFAAAVLIAHVTAQESALTLYGAALYLAARVLYLPLYAFGVPVVRTLVWCVSIAGLLMLFWAILFAS